MVEAALAFPILLALALAIVEFGFAYRDNTVVAGGGQQAGRVAANQATDRFADFEALRVVDSTIDSVRSGSIKRVIVFKANGGITEAPAACKAVAVPDDFSVKGIGGTCNVYGPRQVQTASLLGFRSNSAALDDCTADSWDASWCPPFRDRQSDVPDRVGIYVEVSYGELTGIVPIDMDLSSTAIYQLEPCTAFDPEC